ncbi:nucleoside triphosphate pyrophosphohydrolase [Aestuariirhabdus litorea]|uniref:Nucleoside triphosphate pyrophosphohydrolase n=1 Tax=Aestuariirhabdus litorea TaxID=2528527 RepID=A0A3P3VRR9_9GAMM|nr:nucleoside triphosphate pyrophosphohydrolase [Aestuariirhabdus litorea]RRJ85144.1 nucleoside triphosphate pyrophosphohydrolase [Aestuariirhabdus litorea]RWW98367.1 nucleoside triphosphate pyrophosphohydrolase [Endozoicomonadaceae bacterium GTF-13]
MARYQLEDLVLLMERLRDPETGCPWDLQQSFETIVPYTLEEAYEVADAIRREDYPHVMDELGDLLFQVIFYAQLGKEQQLFELADILDNLVAKLIRRHPHVFPEGTLASRRSPQQTVSQQEIKATWDRIKQQERALKQSRGDDKPGGWLDDLPLSLPALKRAQKLQKRAAEVGFDWDSPQPVVAKIFEEVDELERALKDEGREAALEELGDLMFACVNLARHLGTDAESLMSQANRKFQRRFEGVEAQLRQAGSSLQEADLEQMEALWQRVKVAENGG